MNKKRLLLAVTLLYASFCVNLLIFAETYDQEKTYNDLMYYYKKNLFSLPESRADYFLIHHENYTVNKLLSLLNQKKKDLIRQINDLKNFPEKHKTTNTLKRFVDSNNPALTIAAVTIMLPWALASYLLTKSPSQEIELYNKEIANIDRIIRDLTPIKSTESQEQKNITYKNLMDLYENSKGLITQESLASFLNKHSLHSPKDLIMILKQQKDLLINKNRLANKPLWYNLLTLFSSEWKFVGTNEEKEIFIAHNAQQINSIDEIITTLERLP